MPDYQYMGRRIQEIRLRKGMTKTAFCDLIGIAPNTLYDYERGKKKPKAQIFISVFGSVHKARTNSRRLCDVRVLPNVSGFFRREKDNPLRIAEKTGFSLDWIYGLSERERIC